MSKLETVPAKAGTHIPVHAGTSTGAPVATVEGLADAVRKLVKAKGRFHTEKNYVELADALARYDACHAEPSLSIAPEATHQDLRDVFDLAWNQALADAALYVASHCALEEHHAERILELVPPKLKVRGIEIADRPDEAGAAGAAPARQAEDARTETRMDAGSQPVVALAQEVGVRADFIEWHQDEFGYCCVDDQSFADGDLQAVAWAAWLEAHARIAMKHENGESE